MNLAIDINDVLRDNTNQFKRVYRKFIDPNFEIDDEKIDSWDMFEVFPFEDRDKFFQFKYVDYPFELFGRAEAMEKMLPYRFNDWTQNVLKNLDEDKVPNIIIYSPFEIHMAIQSTLSFLSRIGIREREYFFPADSAKIWDRCDMLITANPNLLENVPEGKIAVKIERPYNKDVECKYTFKSMMDIINDENETIINILENGE